MVRFIVEVSEENDDPDIEPGEIVVRLRQENGDILARSGGPLVNPNVMSYIALKMELYVKSRHGGRPFRLAGIMSDEEIEEEMARIIPI